MEIPIAQVDAFTDTPFRGNPAGVCVLDAPRTAQWMQSVAAEMNVAETAFLEPRADGFGLRWFTPLVEVDLCGHATIASAHVLWETARLPASAQARFHTRSGLLTADRRGAWIELDLPATPAAAAEAPPALAALGVTPKWIGRSRFDYLVEVDSEETVRGVVPDLKALAAVDTRGVIVTAPSASRGYDFVSRFFAPRAGIDEDPVTGSSHCCLGPYWAARLGKQEMTAYQASARGGIVRIRLDGDRIHLAGQAVTVLRGVLIG
jgi:predicted PhzF superfamily epimerase YddE/YHI9